MLHNITQYRHGKDTDKEDAAEEPKAQSKDVMMGKSKIPIKKKLFIKKIEEMNKTLGSSFQPGLT